MDVKRYIERINYSGSTNPSYEVLKKLQKAHLFTVPFENLDIHLGAPIVLEPAKMYHKIVINNRGGFCYELNGLFYKLLVELGFKARIISGRTLNKTTGEYGREFDHLAILVKLHGNEYLSDVGFGEFTLHPLKMETGTIQSDPMGDFVIDTLETNYYRVSKRADGQWLPEYIFTDRERKLTEFGEMCHYQQTSPQSHFTQKRLITMANEKGRITITGNHLKITQDKITEEVAIESEEKFNSYLLNYFKVQLNERKLTT